MSLENPEIKSGSRCAENTILAQSGDHENDPTLNALPGVSSFGSPTAGATPAAFANGTSSVHRCTIA